MSKPRRPSIDKMFALEEEDQNVMKEVKQVAKQRSVLKR